LSRTYALELARRGAAVVVNDIGVDLRGDEGRDRSAADGIISEIISSAGRAIADYGDVVAPTMVERA
jgi:hypothetical protein